ncbi:hypothetical protein [Okeania sp. SIO2C2]|uniref:hypothetical protein n=1 Tax=Okeania sp. SIO2C2 TaxID=2607787 RepID=UPI00257CBA87|nr:hypothetical protein [Okeania sp. SIO2C2]
MDRATESYKVMLAYQDWVENLFRTLDNKFALGLNGKKLSPMPKTKLVVTSTNYLLYNYAIYNGQEVYNTWLPPWVGRFYIDLDYLVDDSPLEDYPAKQVQYITFVWTWLGSKDEYIADTDRPECWVGIVEPKPRDTEYRVYDVAGEIWKCIRVEKDAEKESDGWIFGRFNPNSFGSELNGFWQVRRFPLRDISSIYQTYQLIVNPVTEKLAKLAGGESIRG